MHLMASQCAGLGFAANQATVATANVMSGWVASATQLRAPMALQYGMSSMIVCSAVLAGACLVVSQVEVSIGIDNGLRSTR